MSVEYVERRNGGYYVKGTRVSLDSVVCSFKDAEGSGRSSQPSVSIRFQADNDLNSVIVASTLRREPGIDFQTAQARSFGPRVGITSRIWGRGGFLLATISARCRRV